MVYVMVQMARAIACAIVRHIAGYAVRSMIGWMMGYTIWSIVGHIMGETQGWIPGNTPLVVELRQVRAFLDLTATI
jgi:hypothetical protein